MNCLSKHEKKTYIDDAISERLSLEHLKACTNVAKRIRGQWRARINGTERKTNEENRHDNQREGTKAGVKET